MNIKLELLKPENEEQFIKDNQAAFNYGAKQYFTNKELEEQFEEDEQIISRKTIIDSIHRKGSIAYRIIYDNKCAGGIIINIQNSSGELEIFFVNPSFENKGIGQASWKEIEKKHSDIKIWETVTPYFEKRNIHFYINKLGFHIVEFYNKFSEEANIPEELDGMFKFQKIIL